MSLFTPLPMTLARRPTGIAVFPVPGGLLSLAKAVHLDTLNPLRVLLVAVHGWAPINSIDVEAAEHILQRAKVAIRGCIPTAIIHELPIFSDGAIQERVDHCCNELTRRRSSIDMCDVICFVAHSQGTVVSVFALDRIIENGWLHGKRFGVISLAGVHSGTYEPLPATAPFTRAATSELHHLSRPDHPLSILYRDAAVRVLNRGARIVAFHSYTDTVVHLPSSTLACIVPLHENLAVGIYFTASFSHRYLSDDSYGGGDLLARLAVVWCMGRNAGVRWDERLGLVLREAESLTSSKAVVGWSGEALGRWLTSGVIGGTKVEMAHSEVVGCGEVYSQALLFILSSQPPTIPIPPSPPALSTTEPPDLPTFLITHLSAVAQGLGPTLRPLRTEIEYWLTRFTKYLDEGVPAEFGNDWKRMCRIWDVEIVRKAEVEVVEKNAVIMSG